jgi:hypothetical protein
MKRLRILIAIVFVLNLPLGAQNFCSTPYWQQMRCDAGTCHQAVNVTACSGRFNTIDNCYPGGMPVMCCGGELPNGWRMPCGIIQAGLTPGDLSDLRQRVRNKRLLVSDCNGGLKIAELGAADNGSL